MTMARASCSRLCCSAAVLIAAGFAIAGCSSDPRDGYAFTGAATQLKGGVATVHVPIFQNRTFAVGIEQQLTEAIIKEVQANTTMKVVRSDAAESVLVGTIQKVDMRRLSLREGTGLVQEVAVQVTIDFDWKRPGDKASLVARKNFSGVDTFVPSRPTGERIEIGQYAAIERLAKDVVREMRTQW